MSAAETALLHACEALAKVTSSDGSGHADLAMIYLVRGGYSHDEAFEMVETWKSHRSWTKNSEADD